MGRPPITTTNPKQYTFKEHPILCDKFVSVIADLAEDGIKANRADILRALVMSQIDNAYEVTKAYLQNKG
jgi:hypothetical protein